MKKGTEQVGQLEVRIPAIEYEPVKETEEQKKRTKEQLKEVDWWRKICTCTHSRTAHRTVGTGKCVITGCTCTEYVS